MLLESEVELIKLSLDRNLFSERNSAIYIHSTISWNGTPTELTELIYALYHSGCFSNALLKDVIKLFETAFNVKLNNYSHTFGRIRMRGERCAFLTKIIHNLIAVMDSKDQ